MNLKRKNNGYWNEETILEELKPVIEMLGHFPTAKKLININREDLRTAISEHGGLNYFRKLLGHKPPQKPVGFWTDNNIIEEVTPVIIKLGHFPLSRELHDMKKSSLAHAISRNGGFIKFRIMSKQILKKKE